MAQILPNVLSHLSAKDLAASSTVRKQWKALARADALWEPKVRALFDVATTTCPTYRDGGGGDDDDGGGGGGGGDGDYFALPSADRRDDDGDGGVGQLLQDLSLRSSTSSALDDSFMLVQRYYE